MHVRVGFCVLCFVGKKSFLKASTQTKAPLSLSLSQIFCIDQLVQSYFKRVEVLGSSLHFVGADFFHSRTFAHFAGNFNNFFSKSHNFFIRKPFSEPFFLKPPIFSRSIHWNTYFQHLQLQFSVEMESQYQVTLDNTNYF